MTTSRLQAARDFLAGRGFTLVANLPEFADEARCCWRIVPLDAEAEAEMTQRMKVSLYSIDYALLVVAGLDDIPVTTTTTIDNNNNNDAATDTVATTTATTTN